MKSGIISKCPVMLKCSYKLTIEIIYLDRRPRWKPRKEELRIVRRRLPDVLDNIWIRHDLHFIENLRLLVERIIREIELLILRRIDYKLRTWEWQAFHKSAKI